MLGVGWNPGVMRVGRVVGPLCYQIHRSRSRYCGAPMNGRSLQHVLITFLCSIMTMNHSNDPPLDSAVGATGKGDVLQVACSNQMLFCKCCASAGAYVTQKDYHHHPLTPLIYGQQKVVVHTGVGCGRQLQGLCRWWHTCVGLLLPDECCGRGKSCPSPGDHACSPCGAWHFEIWK